MVFSLLLGSSIAAADCPDMGRELPVDMAEVTPSVLLIERDSGHGSGVLIDPSGLAITAAHVVGLETRVLTTFESDFSLPAEVIAVDHHRDLALLQLNGTHFPCAPIATTPLGRGTDVFSIGAPLLPALAFSVSKGVVSGYPAFGGRRVLQTDTDLQRGNSGGPLLDTSGRIAGIVSSSLTDETLPNIGLAVPSSVMLTWLEEVSQHSPSVDFLPNSPADGRPNLH